MARYDEPTEKFIDDLSGDIKQKALHQAKTITNALIRGTPPQRMLAKQIARSAVEKLYEDKIAGVKLAGISVLKLYSILNDHYQREWWDWEPETLWHTLQADHGIEASEEVKNMIQALQVVVSTDAPFEHWHIFENVGHAFCENPVNFGALQPLELDEAAWTMKVLKTIRPKIEFDDEICGYIAASAKSSGVVFLPAELFGEHCQKFLDDMDNDLALRDQIKFMWPKLQAGSDEVNAQAEKLRTIVEYVRAKM